MPGHKTASAATTKMRAQDKTFPAPTDRDIRLDLISVTEWRVCDRRFAPSDSRAVLGFIERHGFDYEVTDVKAPDRIEVFTGLASATASFTVVD